MANDSVNSRIVNLITDHLIDSSLPANSGIYSSLLNYTIDGSIDGVDADKDNSYQVS